MWSLHTCTYEQELTPAYLCMYLYICTYTKTHYIYVYVYVYVYRYIYIYICAYVHISTCIRHLHRYAFFQHRTQQLPWGVWSAKAKSEHQDRCATCCLARGRASEHSLAQASGGNPEGASILSIGCLICQWPRPCHA